MNLRHLFIQDLLTPTAMNKETIEKQKIDVMVIPNEKMYKTYKDIVIIKGKPISKNDACNIYIFEV